MIHKQSKKGNTQKDIFLKGEGDQWFRRNMSMEPSKDVLLYEKFIKDGDCILEIGCSNGKNLTYLNNKRGHINAYGIDPSEEAISKAKTPISCVVGTADSLPFESDFFDVVILGFCMYLVDIYLLSKVVSEVDRVLKDKGFLIITDFDVKIPRKRKYKHLEGVYTLKYDYSKIFDAFPQFGLIEKYSYSHMDGCEFHPNPKERVCTTILYKDLENAYVHEDDIS